MQMQQVDHADYSEAMRYSLDDAEDDETISGEGAPRRSLRTFDTIGKKLGKKDRNSLELKVAAIKAGQTPSPSNSSVMPSRATLPTPLPLKLNLGPVEENEYEHDNDNSLVLQHSDDEDERDSPRSPRTPMRSASGAAFARADHASGAGAGNSNTPSTAEKAGIILGIHNVYIVLPQFVVTAMSSIIFGIMEPPATAEGVAGASGHPLATGPEEVAADLAGGTEEQGLSDVDVAGEFLGNLVRRAEGAVEGGSSDAVGLIFRCVSCSPNHETQRSMPL